MDFNRLCMCVVHSHTKKNRVEHLCSRSELFPSSVEGKELTIAIKLDADIIILLDGGCGVV